MTGLRKLLVFLAALSLVLAACTSAEEAGEEPEPEADDAGAVSPEPDTEPPTDLATETEAEPDLDVTEPETDDGTDDGQDIMSLLEDNPQLNTLLESIEAANIEDVLEQAEPITVFAPNDRAFQQMTASDLQQLFADPSRFQDILQFHVVEGTLTTSDLNDGDTLTTLGGDTLQVSVDGDDVTVNGAEVVQSDLRAGDSVLHIIDTVLQP